MSNSRLRAAPSPTGYVHIGNLRTFLYNYLFVMKNNGRFILRIEDTDQKRKVDGGTEAIIDVLAMYGIEFDESPLLGGDFGPYVQTERAGLYQEYAERLVDQRLAYRCFCSEERLAGMREEQMKKGIPTGYDGHCREIDFAEADRRALKGEKHVIRMKFPKEGVTKFTDLVYGDITVPNSSIDDQVLLKSDGIPTYHFAVVVDDHFMEITHVVRGREYLSDTPKNIFLYDAFEWEIPEFIHVPHILKPVGQGKLSKRDGALSAMGYIRKGYLPDAILNYIALIGWSPDPSLAKESEIYTLDELIEIFDFSGIQKTGGRYDPVKLDNTNGKHIRLLEDEDLIGKILSWAEFLVDDKSERFEEVEKWELDLEAQLNKYLPLWEADIQKFTKAVATVKERIRYFAELPELLDFFYDEQLDWVDEDWKLNNRNKEEFASALREVTMKLDEIFSSGEFDHDKWESVVRGYADELGWKHGELFLAIRSATTGKLQSPPLLDAFEIMGWEKIKKNLSDAVKWLDSQSE